jgi:hypothetical protein
VALLVARSFTRVHSCCLAACGTGCKLSKKNEFQVAQLLGLLCVCGVGPKGRAKRVEGHSPVVPLRILGKL